MKSTFHLAALLTAGLLIGACSKDKNIVQVIEPEPNTETPVEQAEPVEMAFSATITAKESATKSVNADGVTAWQVDEKIAVYYQKDDDTFATAEANVDAVENGSATISATLTDAKNGTEVKFVYPATLANTTGGISTTTLQAQHGTIADISAHFDAATGTGTLVTDGTTCGTESSVHMSNQAFIGKFTPKFGGSPIDGITELTISDGTYTYTVTPESPATAFDTGGIYVAMLPVNKKPMTITADTAGKVYYYSSGSNTITLEVGKLYNNLAIPMIEIHSRTGYGNGLPIN